MAKTLFDTVIGRGQSEWKARRDGVRDSQGHNRRPARRRQRVSSPGLDVERDALRKSSDEK